MNEDCPPSVVWLDSFGCQFLYELYMLTQLVKHLLRTQNVAGWSPARGSSFFLQKRLSWVSCIVLCCIALGVSWSNYFMPYICIVALICSGVVYYPESSVAVAAGPIVKLSDYDLILFFIEKIGCDYSLCSTSCLFDQDFTA